MPVHLIARGGDNGTQLAYADKIDVRSGTPKYTGALLEQKFPYKPRTSRNVKWTRADVIAEWRSVYPAAGTLAAAKAKYHRAWQHLEDEAQFDRHNDASESRAMQRTAARCVRENGGKFITYE